MQVNPKILKQKFEKSMPKYNENAIVQREMAEILVDLLIQKVGQNFMNVLELGSGTGILTEIIIRNLKYNRLTCNDIVEKSKFYLDKITPKYDFIVGNSVKIKPYGKQNLIISNAMFQWFASLSVVLRHYKNILADNGVLAFTTFAADNFKEIRNALGISLNYLSLEEIKSVVAENYEILAVEKYERVTEFNSPLELLAHLKNTGVNSLKSAKMTFTEIKSFCEKISDENGKCLLTYAPVIVIAVKHG